MHTLLALYIKRAKFTKKTNSTSPVPNKNILHAGVTVTRSSAKERCMIVGQMVECTLTCRKL
jgi:hypothetical protein